MLIFGKLRLGETKHVQGCFQIKDSATIEGPSKFYYSNLSMLTEIDRKSEQAGGSIRRSFSKYNARASNNK